MMDDFYNLKRPTMLLLDAIRHANELYLAKEDAARALETLLETLVALTDSEYGLLAKTGDRQGESFKTTILARIHLNTMNPSGALHEKIWTEIQSRFAAFPAVATRPVIVNPTTENEKHSDQSSAPPLLQSFLGHPLHFRGELLGVVWIANRAAGYDETLIDWLQPLFSTCAGIIHAEHVHEMERRHSRDILHESESKYRFLVQSTNDIILILDGQGVLRFISPSIERIAGYRPEELEGQSAFTHIHPDDLPEVIETFTAKLNQAGASVRAEYRYRHKDGDWRYFEADAINLLFDPHAQGILVSVRDMTERHLAQEELRQLTLRQEALLSAIPDIIMEVDSRRVYTWANTSGRKFFGDDVIGREAADFFVGDQNIYQQVDAIFHGEENVVYLESWQRRKDGAIRLLAWWCRVVKDQEGKVLGAISTARDITEHNWAEEKLRQSEERFRLLVQNSNDIITILDAEGRQTFISGPVERILGYPPEELTGIFPLERIHPDDQGAVREAFMERIPQPGSMGSARYRYRHRNDRWIYLEAVGANRLDDPVVRGIVLNIRDISERQEAEAEKNKLQEQLQQAMKMEAVGRLAGGVAHDFNNLLTGITGNVELALMELSPRDPLAGPLREIKQAAESAASLTRQLLAFSRKQIITPKVINLNQLIGNMHKMLVRLIGEDVILTTVPGVDLGFVLVDPGQFEQVLVNLAVNARDAMPQGGSLIIETANVELDAHDCTRHTPLIPGPHVMLAVSDSGIGMNAEIRSRLFEPFFTTKPKDQGTGLGLATTYGAVKQAGGTIEVYSESGQGTVFKIYLPRVTAQPEGKTEPVREELYRGGNETVFVVEDDESVRRLAVRILERAGYRVLAASHGREALMTAEKHRESITVLMSDVVMPGMNGRELAEQFVKLHPESIVLYTSGYTEDVIVHHGVIDKGLNFLSKPYSPTALTKKIRGLIDTRKK